MENAKFKSPQAEKRWVELQESTTVLKSRKPTASNLDKIDIFISLMTACKNGFNLSDGRIKKIINFLQEKTGSERVRYGTLPKDIKPSNIMFKEVTVLYAEKDGQIIFREFDHETINVLQKEEPKKMANADSK